MRSAKKENPFTAARRQLKLKPADFEERILKLLRRMETLRAAQRGDIRLKAVWVEPYTVHRYKVGGHYRYYDPRPRRKK